MIEVIGLKLMQWDLDRQLKITTNEKIDEIHVANIGDSVALRVKPKEVEGVRIVDIPNINLQTSRNLVVFTYAEGRTIGRYVFEIASKPKPEDYVYKESEILSYRALEERIRNIEEHETDINITVDDALNEESENPVQNKVVAKQFQDIDEKIGVINLHKVTTVATLSSGRSSAFVYQLDKRISGLFKVPNLPPMYWYIYDETGTRINYYSFGACPTKIDLKDNDTTVTAIVYFVTGRVTKVMYSIADNTFATEVFEYSKYDIDQLINAKQNATDETLKTNDKTIVGAINEINGKIPTVQDVLDALPTWQGGAF